MTESNSMACSLVLSNLLCRVKAITISKKKKHFKLAESDYGSGY